MQEATMYFNDSDAGCSGNANAWENVPAATAAPEH
jgi:hypothetical protein